MSSSNVDLFRKGDVTVAAVPCLARNSATRFFSIFSHSANFVADTKPLYRRV